MTKLIVGVRSFANTPKFCYVLKVFMNATLKRAVETVELSPSKSSVNALILSSPKILSFHLVVLMFCTIFCM